MSKKKYSQLTDNVVHSICEYVMKGHSTKDACLIVNVPYSYLEQLIGGEECKRPEWRDAISHARALCKDFWLAVLREEKVSNPRVKAAMIMLGALDPETYREQRQQVQGGVMVYLLQSAEGKITTAKVLDTDGKELPTSTLGLPEVVVEPQ